jgi:hypothetical protein
MVNEPHWKWKGGAWTTRDDERREDYGEKTGAGRLDLLRSVEEGLCDAVLTRLLLKDQGHHAKEAPDGHADSSESVHALVRLIVQGCNVCLYELPAQVGSHSGRGQLQLVQGQRRRPRHAQPGAEALHIPSGAHAEDVTDGVA